MNRAVVYFLLSPSGKIYVGQTIHLQRRLREHEQGAKHGSQIALSRAIRRYGMVNIETAVLAEDLSQAMAKRLEVVLISLLLADHKKYGYNLTRGGDGVSGLSEESRQKISKARQRQFTDPTTRARFAAAQRRRFLNPRERLRISKATQEAMKNPAVKKKLSEAAMGNTIRRGHKLSEETREKIAAANRGKKASAETRRKMSRSLLGSTNR